MDASEAMVQCACEEHGRANLEHSAQRLVQLRCARTVRWTAAKSREAQYRFLLQEKRNDRNYIRRSG
jgi:hypothetical protein